MAPVSIPPSGTYHGSNTSEEFPPRNQYPFNATDPFRDPRGFAPGSIVPANFAGVAGVGAGGASVRSLGANDMQYRGANNSPISVPHPYAAIGAVENGISYDSGPYPAPATRSRSLRQVVHMPVQRSPSMSTNSMTHSSGAGSNAPLPPVPAQYAGAPPPPPPQRLPRIASEAYDENPYDGLSPESDLPNPHAPPKGEPQGSDEIPRVLRVSS